MTWPPAGTVPQCYACAHLRPLEPGSGWWCDAFERIPKAILTNAADHRQPYPGDGGVTFQPLEKLVVDAAEPRRAAGVLFVTPDDRVLLMRRTDAGDHDGEWSIPAGKVEDGETPAEAAAREAEEETGHRVDPEELEEWARRTHGGLSFTTFRVRVDEPFDVRLNGEHDDWMWADRRGLAAGKQ